MLLHAIKNSPAAELIAVSFPGMDLPGLCESEWNLVRGPTGHLVAFMVNWRDKWIDASDWLNWLKKRGVRP